jgi:hypothetical protein
MKRLVAAFVIVLSASSLGLAGAPASAEPIEPCEEAEVSIVTGSQQELVGQVQVGGNELTPCI